MTANDWTEIEERFERLSFEDKLRVLEQLIRQLRRGSIDPVAFEQGIREMAADPAVQRELGQATGRPS
ncbi:MAG TPA: hypothetical protein VH575_08095 [Gemmataceae bacterium]|jgi:hypothetical protein